VVVASLNAAWKIGAASEGGVPHEPRPLLARRRIHGSIDDLDPTVRSEMEVNDANTRPLPPGIITHEVKNATVIWCTWGIHRSQHLGLRRSLQAEQQTLRQFGAGDIGAPRLIYAIAPAFRVIGIGGTAKHENQRDPQPETHPPHQCFAEG
jgi:hypothetical protein